MSDRFAQHLLKAADEIEDFSRSELRVLLRRAALRISNRASADDEGRLDPVIELAIDRFADEQAISRDDAVYLALYGWLAGQGYIMDREPAQNLPAKDR